MSNKTIVNWYDLKDYEILYINKHVMKNLINKGIVKAGSLSKLMLELNSGHIYNILRNNNGFSIKNLKKLLEFLGLDYTSLNGKITEVRKGKKYSIRDPKFPINLQNPKIGDLLGHLVSDGCLYYDKSRKNLIRTKYCSDEEEAICMFMVNICTVFGNVHYNREFERNCTQIRIGTGIVGEVLKRAGGIVGKKYEINGGIPWIVKTGSRDLKRAYLAAIFSDEGCVGKAPSPYITLSRNIHCKFNAQEKEVLRRFVVPLMTRSFFPTGHSTSRIQIRKLKEVLTKLDQKNLLDKVLNAKPKILMDESELLENEFKIKNSTYVMSLQLTANGNYSIQSSMIIRNKTNVVTFYKTTGFSLTKKQKKLKEALASKGWLDHGA